MKSVRQFHFFYAEASELDFKMGIVLLTRGARGFSPGEGEDTDMNIQPSIEKLNELHHLSGGLTEIPTDQPAHRLSPPLTQALIGDRRVVLGVL
jgi:hypothetical protein